MGSYRRLLTDGVRTPYRWYRSHIVMIVIDIAGLR